MDKINISFTKVQYRSLLKLIYLGEWMHEAHQEAESKDVKEVVQLIFSRTKEADTENMIEYAENLKMFFPTKNMEEIIHLLVDDYDEHVFWEELVDELAFRDFINKFGDELIEQMSAVKRMELLQPFLDKYMNEFEANDISNLVIKKGK